MEYSFTYLQWTLVIASSIIIGFSKSGIKGVEMLNVLFMAIVFGSKASTGVVLPLLCIADMMAVIYYKRHVQWKYFWKLIPAMLFGVLLGVWIGKDIDEMLFKKIMALIIIFTILLILYIEKTKNTTFPDKVWFSTSMGLIAGFTTMMGNLAGAFANIYFLALKLKKNDFIGTAAWVFLVINLFKVPFQVFVWKNINTSTLLLDLKLLPFLIIGFFVGLKIVGKINELFFRRLIMAITIVGSILILFK